VKVAEASEYRLKHLASGRSVDEFSVTDEVALSCAALSAVPYMMKRALAS